MISGQAQEKPPSEASEESESRQDPTPYILVREKKFSGKRATCPKSLPIQFEGHLSQKRARPNSVAACLECIVQGTSRPPTPIGNKHSGNTSVHPILLV